MLQFTILDPQFHPDMLGFIPMFLHENNPRPAKEQLDSNYRHGGGWNPFMGFTLDKEDMSIQYPGDPKLHPIAHATLRDEKIYVYPYAWVLILQPDGSFEISRMD